MQKYNEDDLYNAFNKVAADHIKTLRKKILKYLNSLSGDIKNIAKKHFYTDIESNPSQDWYSGHSIYDHSVGGMVYFYDFDDVESDYEKDLKDILDHIIQIIKSEKCDFKFTIYKFNYDSGPIELCISIDDLVKLYPDIKIKSELNIYEVSSIIRNIIDANNKDITKGLKSILKKYECSDKFSIARMVPDVYSSDNLYVGFITLNHTNKSIDKKSAEIKQLSTNIANDVKLLLAKYFKFKYKIVSSSNFIRAEINIKDVKSDKIFLDALKEFNIFESVKFL